VKIHDVLSSDKAYYPVLILRSWRFVEALYLLPRAVWWRGLNKARGLTFVYSFTIYCNRVTTIIASTLTFLCPCIACFDLQRKIKQQQINRCLLIRNIDFTLRKTICGPKEKRMLVFLQPFFEATINYSPVSSTSIGKGSNHLIKGCKSHEGQLRYSSTFSFTSSLLLLLWGPSAYTSGSTSALSLFVLSPVLDIPTFSTSSALPRPLSKESWNCRPVI
jgi:hypothetical protein